MMLPLDGTSFFILQGSHNPPPPLLLLRFFWMLLFSPSNLYLYWTKCYLNELHPHLTHHWMETHVVIRVERSLNIREHSLTTITQGLFLKCF